MNNSVKRINSWAFCQYNACPDRTACVGGMAQSVLNVFSVINQCNWQSAYESLLAEAHMLGFMPDDIHCVKALLTKQGFFQQPKIKETISIEDFCRAMDNRCHNGQIAVIQVANRRTGSELLAVVPDEYANFIGKRSRFGQYLRVGFEYPSVNLIQEVWVKWEDCKDHSPAKRRKGRGLSTPVTREIPDTEFFHYYLSNPAGRYVGDCSVRALSAACGITWCEAMNRLAKSTDYLETRINIEPFINKMLESEGFSKHHPIHAGGKLLTGKDFCREMSARYNQGVRIFAYVGSGHVAAILPFQEDGTTRYKMVDSWDSTDQKIGTYFVKPVSDGIVQRALQNGLNVGMKVVHPVFGEGVIKGISQHGWLVVSFCSDQRLLDTKWVLTNCRRVA